MKMIVLYTSQCGSTKQYAEAIAKEFGAQACNLRKYKHKKLSCYDTIVYGGWVNNGEIKGLNDFLVHWNEIQTKNVIVFSTGVSIPKPQTRQELIDCNFLSGYHLRFYQLRGSCDLSKLKFPYSWFIKMFIKKTESNPNAAAEQRALAELKNNPVQYYDHEGIERICSVIRNIHRTEG